MSARDTILRAVRAAKPPAIPHPGGYDRRPGPDDLSERFKAELAAAGASIVEARRSQLAALVRSLSSGSAATLSALPHVPSTVAAKASHDVLGTLELFVVQAELGIAENGAMWLPLSRIVNHAALFLAEHVVVAIEKHAIVDDLHAAYERMNVGSEPFGVFVAGPSKTADIEQSLVIGAHGPKRLTVVYLLPGESDAQIDSRR